MGSEINRRGQVTIFIILAIIIVVGVIGAVYFMRSGEIEAPTIDSSDPLGSIRKCSTDAVEEAIGILLPHGGYIETREPSIFYKETHVSYLCHTSSNKEICNNLEPMLIQRVESEIESYVSPIIENCFAGLKNELKNNDYIEGPTSLDIKIQTGQVMVLLDKSISFEIADHKSNFDNFDSKISSPVYDFFRITNDIINGEVVCDCGVETCNADIIGISRAERSVELERFVTGRNEKVYTIRDIFSGKEFVFGVRNCVRLPA